MCSMSETIAPWTPAPRSSTLIATSSHEARGAAGAGAGFADGSGFAAGSGATARPQAARIAVSASSAAHRVHKRLVVFTSVSFRQAASVGPSNLLRGNILHVRGYVKHQASAASKAVRVRVLRLNSTPIRWMDVPRPRYLAA